LDDGTCPGVCNRSWRKAQAAYHQALAAYDPLDPATSRPEPPSIRPVAGHPWCLECQAVIRVQFGQLDRLASLRTSILMADGYPSDTSAERLSGSTEDVSPSPAGDDVHDTDRMLADWEWGYRRLRGWPAAERYGDLADQRTECIVWLEARLDGILSSDMAADFGREVMEHHADLRAKTKAGIRTLKKPLRCPKCRLLMLCLTDGEQYVKCCAPYCGYQMPLDEYYATVDSVAEGLSEPQAATLLAVRS
jgi:hypothetical protein